MIRSTGAFSVQVQDRLDPAAPGGVYLGPDGQDRDLVKGIDLFTVRRIRDVGHKVDLPFCQALQSLGPGAGYIAQVPAFAFRDVLDDIDKDARGLAGFGGENLRRVFIHADRNNPGLGPRRLGGKAGKNE